jgi:hypothetical protein
MDKKIFIYEYIKQAISQTRLCQAEYLFDFPNAGKNKE